MFCSYRVFLVGRNNVYLTLYLTADGARIKWLYFKCSNLHIDTKWSSCAFVFRSAFQEPSLDLLAKYMLNSSVELQRAAEVLVQSSIERMSVEQREAIVAKCQLQFQPFMDPSGRST